MVVRHLLSALVLMALWGCSSNDQGTSSNQEPNRADELNDVAGLLRAYCGENNRGPKKAADLEKYEQGYPLGIEPVRSGEIVIVWGAMMGGEGDVGQEGKIIAYEKKAPTEGGDVLFTNGEIKNLSASEFQETAKAK